MSTDLVAWLRVQLDEDERVACAATPGPWRTSRAWETTSQVLAEQDDRDIVADRPDGSSLSVASDHEGFGAVHLDSGEHIARWNPTRVLAEVAAKRRRLDFLAAAIAKCPEGDWPESGDMSEAVVADMARYLVKFEAQPHAGRPGWRQEWALQPR